MRYESEFDGVFNTSKEKSSPSTIKLRPEDLKYFKKYSSRLSMLVVSVIAIGVGSMATQRGTNVNRIFAKMLTSYKGQCFEIFDQSERPYFGDNIIQLDKNNIRQFSASYAGPGTVKINKSVWSVDVDSAKYLKVLGQNGIWGGVSTQESQNSKVSVLGKLITPNVPEKLANLTIDAFTEKGITPYCSSTIKFKIN